MGRDESPVSFTTVLVLVPVVYVPMRKLNGTLCSVDITAE